MLATVFPLGCGPSTAGPKVAGSALDWPGLGQAFHVYQKGQKRLPRGPKDLQSLQNLFPAAIASVTSKEVLVYWGVGMSDGPDAASTVLAYHKNVPENGGEVLMQDGTAKEDDGRGIPGRPETRRGRQPKGQCRARKSSVAAQVKLDDCWKLQERNSSARIAIPGFGGPSNRRDERKPSRGSAELRAESHAGSKSRRRLGPLDVLALSAWCGLAAGWAEVGTRVLLKSIIPTNRMYLMTRQFVWLVPLSNLLMFFVVGLILASATKVWPTCSMGQPSTSLCGGRSAGASGGWPSNLFLAGMVLALGIRWSRGAVARKPGDRVAPVDDAEPTRVPGTGPGRCRPGQRKRLAEGEEGSGPSLAPGRFSQLAPRSCWILYGPTV